MTKFVYICDRCGRETPEGKAHAIIIRTDGCTKNIGEICEECFQDFCDFAESFFDELNKEATDGKAEAD